MSENEVKDSVIVSQKKDLISGDEFNKALDDAANLKKEILTSCKERNHNNYTNFYDISLVLNPKIQEILDIKKKNRTDEQNNEIKEFKKATSQTYKMVCDLLTPEDLEDGELTKAQKIVQKVTRVVKMLDYLGNHDIEDEFSKAGIKLQYTHLKDIDVYANDKVKQDITDIFDIGKKIKTEINDNSEAIKTDIYTQSVPPDLQFDKSMNPVGIKTSDFAKLVDLKTKILMAKDDEAKEKVSEQAENLASDYVFQSSRNEVINHKILELIPDEN